MAERVQKILSQWGIASRRKAEKMIAAGRIKINGQTAILGDRVDLATDILHVDGQQVRAAQRPQLAYLLLNKPTGVVSTCNDPQKRPTVIDLLPDNLARGRGIHPVGRLDFASSGALILTNDGELTLGLTHPRYHLPKTYLVQLNRAPRQQDLARWRQGIRLDGRKTLPAQVSLTPEDPSKRTLTIVLTEGRNRQIRRVAQQLGYRVETLHRLAIGSISLDLAGDSQLSAGQHRYLTPAEINFLQNSFELRAIAATARLGGAVNE
ncbi:MAG: pseudouridine synthase [Cyanobacteria bacterium J06623_7]